MHPGLIPGKEESNMIIGETDGHCKDIFCTVPFIDALGLGHLVIYTILIKFFITIEVLVLSVIPTPRVVNKLGPAEGF